MKSQPIPRPPTPPHHGSPRRRLQTAQATPPGRTDSPLRGPGRKPFRAQLETAPHLSASVWTPFARSWLLVLGCSGGLVLAWFRVVVVGWSGLRLLDGSCRVRLCSFFPCWCGLRSFSVCALDADYVAAASVAACGWDKDRLGTWGRRNRLYVPLGPRRRPAGRSTQISDGVRPRLLLARRRTGFGWFDQPATPLRPVATGGAGDIVAVISTSRAARPSSGATPRWLL